MAFDRSLLSEKLQKYREQFQVSISQLSEATGIDEKLLIAYEEQEKIPSGDEILILSYFYKCDYKFFISSDKLAPFEQTETLFRRHGNEFSLEDRWAIQEFLYLAECEAYLDVGSNNAEFSFEKPSSNHKKNGIKAARELRTYFKYSSNAVPMDIYDDFRKIGIRTYRRKLHNSSISGLYIKHPVAGKCILINYNEDIYRQRFTAAHEAQPTLS
jgi:transcriptional regulator with XRE-family HTH domain